MYHCRAILLVPRLPAEYAVWMGEIKPLEWFAKEYQVEEARYTDELEAILLAIAPARILRNYGKSTDSGHFSHPGEEAGGVLCALLFCLSVCVREKKKVCGACVCIF